MPLERLTREWIGFCTERLLEHGWAPGNERQYYHDLDHSMKKLPTIARRFLRCSCREQFDEYFPVVRMACAGHDLIQQSTVGPSPDGTVMVRKRSRPSNEDETADLVVEQLKKLNSLHGFPLKEEYIGHIEQGIRFTAAVFDPDLKTMVQDRLWKALRDGAWHPISMALPVADLGDAGKNPGSFLEGGDDLLREEQVEISKAIRTAYVAGSRSNISEADQIRFLAQLKKWDSFQPIFARGRKRAFDFEIHFLPESAQKSLRERFNRFDETAARCERRALRRSTYDFWRYVEDIGFDDIPPA